MLIETLSALLIVVSAIILVRLALHWFGFAPGQGSGRAMRVVESCPLGTKQRMLIVEVQGERLLLASSESSVQLLRKLGPAEQAVEDERPTEGKALRFARSWLRGLGIAACLLGVLTLAEPALAQSVEASSGGDGSTVSLSLDGITEPGRISSTLQILFLMTLLSVAPSLLLVGTCFTRVVIVLSLLRQAIGIHQLPPNQIIVGLALFVTFYVMAPVGHEIKLGALDPYIAEEIDEREAIQQAVEPVRQFMMRSTRQKDLDLFLTISDTEMPEDIDEAPISALVPAYLISEIRTAFEIGFMIYLPFLIVDIIIASMLISMGMIVLPPIIISLPFKLMLFVLLDGWNLTITALVTGLL